MRPRHAHDRNGRSTRSRRQSEYGVVHRGGDVPDMLAAAAAVISFRNCSVACPPNAIHVFISSSGCNIVIFESIRFFISSTRCALRPVTSGRPRKVRASSGVQSTSIYNFMEHSPRAAYNLERFVAVDNSPNHDFPKQTKNQVSLQPTWPSLLKR